MSHKFLVDDDALGLGTVLWELLSEIMLFWEMFVFKVPLGGSGI